LSNFFGDRAAAVFWVKLSAAFFFVVIIAGCARQFHLQPELFERRQYILTKEILAAQQITDFRGSGNITIVENGRRSSGKFDVRYKSGSSFRAQVYSPFGSTAARIDADSVGGRLSAGRDEYRFTLDESMEVLPFSWGSYFTFGQFMQVLVGKMPDDMALLDTRPDSLTFDRSSAAALWNRDALTIEARINRKSEALESAAFSYNILGDTFTLQFGRFKNGSPGEISIRADSRNYILLRYDR